MTVCFFFSIGRYLFLTAIANQLRYPNSHTHYFSCTLLYLFAEANTEAIQEQITRYFSYEPYHEKKPAFLYAKTKAQISCIVTTHLISAFVFDT